MASSRLERIGTIYTRVKGLLQSGAMKQSDKPLWYDVYEAFPPKVEPTFGRKPPDTPIKDIIYPEDFIRAKYYKRFGNVETISLFDETPTKCQKFVEKYMEMKKDFTNEEDLFESVVKAIQEEEEQLAKASLSRKPEIADTDKSESIVSMYNSAMKKKPRSQPNKINLGEILAEKE